MNKRRRLTCEVKIGNLQIGGIQPIRIQSMTDTSTMDTHSTVEQTIQLFRAGAELVRITTPGIREAKNLEAIKMELNRNGFSKPICADVHYSTNAAEMAALFVEKVRINPGNFIDKPYSKDYQLNDYEYRIEIQKIKEKLVPLIKICRKRKVVIRIGTNHGSLSPRILQKFGNTPEGMVESTMEFLRICKSEDFKELVISLKASNPIITVEANRLLVQKMKEEEMNYPLHLGVTEAGEGIEGRLNSLIGIGSLLREGIGDTIRISLTEPPINEIPVAKELIRLNELLSETIAHRPESYKIHNHRKKSRQLSLFGGKNSTMVLAPLACLDELNETQNFQKPDILIAKNNDDLRNLKCNFPLIIPFNHPDLEEYKGEKIPLIEYKSWKSSTYSAPTFVLFMKNIDELKQLFKLKIPDKAILMVNIGRNEEVDEFVNIWSQSVAKKAKNPIIICADYSEEKIEEYIIKTGFELAYPFLLGHGNGLFLRNTSFPFRTTINLSFRLLQACGARRTKAEFVSCPGCGRSLFDLQSSTRMIKKRLAHLSHLKIAVMGCIVNGLGEMVDADYGYVGSGKQKVSLYRNKELLAKHIHESVATDMLIELIKADGKWIPEA